MVLAGVTALFAGVQYDRSEVYWADFGSGLLYAVGMLAFSEFFIWMVAKVVLAEELRPELKDQEDAETFS